MTNKYLYGTYGFVENSVIPSAEKSPTTIVYVGTAPVNLTRGYQEYVNKPVIIEDYLDAQRKIGFSNNWNDYTLMEAVEAHFNNPLGNVGPIIVINVLNPDIHKKSGLVTATLEFTEGKASIPSDTIILDTLALDDLVEGLNYEIQYDYSVSKVVIIALTEVEGEVAASYKETDPTMVQPSDIVGESTIDGVSTGIGAVRLIYPEYNKVPGIILAPGFSHNSDVYQALVSAREKINDRWDSFVLVDIPLMEGATAIDTLTKANAWKNANNFNSGYSKVCWPMGMDVESGKTYHMSTLAGWTMLTTDMSNTGIPMETPANKQVPIDRLYYGESSPNKGYDRSQANMLTQNGITTALYYGGSYKLWGDHTAAYKFDIELETADPIYMFDTNIRMLMYISNSFQDEWNYIIDEPMSRNLIDTIINREIEKLDRLVVQGALLGTPKIQFIQTENSANDLIQGKFRFDHIVTITPPTKALSAYVSYTDEGLSNFYGEEA